MMLAVIVGTSIVLGSTLMTLLWAAWRGATRRAERRSLASALTGEIVAVLRAVEMENPGQVNLPSGDAAETRPPHLVLPRFTVYEANAGKLDHFAVPLPRKITYFFDRMGTLAQECGTIAKLTSDETARIKHCREMRDDLKTTLDLADEILLDLRPLMSPHTRAKHLI